MNTTVRARLGRALRNTLVITGTVALVAPAAAWASHVFTDVSDSAFYASAVSWAKTNGVTNGCNPAQGNTRFCPEDNVSRGQMAVFLRNLSNSRAVDAGTIDGIDSAALATDAEVDDLFDAYDAFIPIATFYAFGVESDPTLDTVSYRSPVTGPPTMTRTGTGTYRVDLPGVTANSADHIVQCTGNAVIPLIVVSGFSSGDVSLQLRDADGLAEDSVLSGFTCTVYKS